MNSANPVNNSKQFDDDLFEDSDFAAKFQESTFLETITTTNKSYNTSLNKSNLNVSALCCDEEIGGYDKLTGRTWIYPTNYSVRDYQYNIINAALLKNTLVSLPTGLGKTFIAAVVMYNFFRWYPLGKIVFTAPTRPLVAQQIDACYNIVAIPPGDTIEMTGNMQANTRKIHWKSKRVFFATPQVIYNDIKSGICPSEFIRCLVIDEAHRARGNYAYCQIVNALDDLGCKTYRLLALSATPGSKVEDVINVVKHLHIAHLELRTEECIDVAPYSHSRRIITDIIQLGPELTQLRQQYVEILDGYARRLKQLNILPQNVGNYSKGRIVMLYKEYQTKERGSRHPQHNYIMKDFTLLIALFHGLELLTKHGSRVFLNFFDEHPEKSWIQSDDQLTALLERLRDDLGVNPLSLDRSILPDGTLPEIPKDLRFGHPKFEKLRTIMMEHFSKAKEKAQDTRAIVFCEYRESVNLVHCLLLQCRPLITAHMFVGQGASGRDGKAAVSQKQQLRVMSGFRSGACNALVATCVAEEGLDVGSVDLIVCFDISTRSPVRLVQRCGRTGRERGGQVHILVTEGKEHQTLLDCMRQRDGLNKKILQSKDVKNNLYKNNPRMMPRDVAPECQKMFITVEKKIDPKEAKASSTKNSKGQKDLRNMLMRRASSSVAMSAFDQSTSVTKAEFEAIFPQGFEGNHYFNDSKEYWCMNKETLKTLSSTGHHAQMSAWLEWQRSAQAAVAVEHSEDANMLCALLRYSDAKRLELSPATQNPSFNTQELQTLTKQVPVTIPVKVVKKKSKATPAKAAPKNDGDIRALFSTATKSMKSYTKLMNDLGMNKTSLPSNLMDIIVDFTLENSTNSEKCYVCLSLDDCSIFRNNKNNFPLSGFLRNPNLPDIGLIGELKPGSIVESLIKVETESQFLVAMDEIISASRNISTNFDLEFDFSSPEETNQQPAATDKNFDIGDIEDIFNESSPEEAANEKNPTEDADEKNTSKPKDALEFFGLDSIEDIFADSDNSANNTPSESKVEVFAPQILEINTEIMPHKENTTSTLEKEKEILIPLPLLRPASPSILLGHSKTKEPTSPILCSQRKFSLSNKNCHPSTSTPNIKRNSDIAFQTPLPKQQTQNVTNSSNVSNNKTMFTITQLVEIINKPGDGSKIHEQIQNDDQILANILNEREKSTSPILLSQADRNRSSANHVSNSKIASKKSESLIVLESDSDSDDTVVYSFESKVKSPFKQHRLDIFKSPLSVKRKLEHENGKSPFFSKKLKLEDDTFKPLSLQQKIIAALNANDRMSQKNTSSCATGSPTSSQKENRSPVKLFSDLNTYNIPSPLEKLQVFRRDRNRRPLNGTCKPATKKKIDFDDSDDDFVADSRTTNNKPNTRLEKSSLVNHKIRKKRKEKNRNQFIDMEAELSQSSDDSGDELTDESVGSIAEFIDEGHVPTAPDMYAHYLNSVKSAPTGKFKIPDLPNRFNNEEIFSQFVEEDNYEMDSFCVDSHIGLTQANDLSELEIAEQILERKKRGRRKVKEHDETTHNKNDDNDDSPIVKRVNRKAKRRISSDSDSS